jgi:hypothetical protein
MPWLHYQTQKSGKRYQVAFKGTPRTVLSPSKNRVSVMLSNQRHSNASPKTPGTMNTPCNSNHSNHFIIEVVEEQIAFENSYLVDYQYADM